MNSEDKNRDRFNEPRSGRAFAGLVLVIIGGALLGRQMGLEIPEWVLTWEMLVIGLGVFFGARRMFRPGGWLIMIIVGAIFLLDEYSNMGFHNLIWPAVIILFGLWMILKPKRSRRDSFLSESVSSDNYVDANSVFGGTKKKIMTKDFKGGNIDTVFGGTDLDFMQADINGSAVLNVNIVFGGAKLLVPPHWKVQSDVDCIFGGVEDKRRDTSEVSEKTLVLKGSVVFGGIEIKSY